MTTIGLETCAARQRAGNTAVAQINLNSATQPATVGTVDAELLGLNQLLSDGHSFGSIAIHTHDCGSHAAKGGAQ